MPTAARETDVYLSAAQCRRRYGVHATTWWRWVQRGHAPAPYRFGEGTTRWLLSELEAWEAAQSEPAAAS